MVDRWNALATASSRRSTAPAPEPKPTEKPKSWWAEKYGNVDGELHSVGTAKREQTRIVDQETQNRRDWDQGINAGQVNTRKLSWDEYNALNPRQRAAVDANTALYEAVAADRAAATNGMKGDAAYQKRVTDLFGANGGSDTYAPNTVALLEKLGLGNKLGDLDRVLDLNSLVNENDLTSIPADVASQMSAAPGAAVRGATAVRQHNAQVFSESALANLGAALGEGRGFRELNDPNTPVGFTPDAAPGTADARLNQLFDVMATGELNNDELNQTVAAFESEYGLNSQAIFDYLEKRLRKNETDAALGHAAPLGSVEGLQYLDPAAFRTRYYTKGT